MTRQLQASAAVEETPASTVAVKATHAKSLEWIRQIRRQDLVQRGVGIVIEMYEADGSQLVIVNEVIRKAREYVFINFFTFDRAFYKNALIGKHQEFVTIKARGGQSATCEGTVTVLVDRGMSFRGSTTNQLSVLKEMAAAGVTVILVSGIVSNRYYQEEGRAGGGWHGIQHSKGAMNEETAFVGSANGTCATGGHLEDGCWMVLTPERHAQLHALWKRRALDGHTIAEAERLQNEPRTRSSRSLSPFRALTGERSLDGTSMDRM